MRPAKNPEFYTDSRNFILSYIRTHTIFSYKDMFSAFAKANPDVKEPIFAKVLKTLRDDKRVFPLNKKGFYSNYKTIKVVPEETWNKYMQEVSEKRKNKSVKKEKGVSKTAFAKVVLSALFTEHEEITAGDMLKQFGYADSEYLKSTTKADVATIMYNLKHTNYLAAGKERGYYKKGKAFNAEKKITKNNSLMLEVEGRMNVTITKMEEKLGAEFIRIKQKESSTIEDTKFLQDLSSSILDLKAIKDTLKLIHI